MNIGLIADTQGSFDVEALVRHVAEQFAGVDEIWHAGDWGREAVLAGLRQFAALVVVNGNAPDDARYPMTVERTIAGWRFGMIHNLAGASSAWVAGLDVCIHAHSHRWRDETIGRTHFLNPGTATRPQFGGKERTMARIRVGESIRIEKLFVPEFPIRAPV